MKSKIIPLILLMIIIALPVLVSCETAKQVVVDNKELIKQVLKEVIDQIIDLITKTPNASISKSVLKMSPTGQYLTVDIYDFDNNKIKSVSYDLLKRYQELKGQ